MDIFQSLKKLISLVANTPLIWLVIVMIAIPAFVSVLRPGYFSMQDDMQAFRIHQMDKCFQDRQIPCRWVPDMGYQYGYPQFNFYSPSIYYLGEILHLLGFQFIDAVKALIVLGFIASALAMFLLLRSLTATLPAVVGTILYTYVPVKAVQVYVRGSLSEFWALVFYPLIFWSSYQLIKTGKIRYLIYLALSTGLLLTTHNIMSVLFLPLLLSWVVFGLVLEKKWKRWGQVGAGGLLGLGLSAFFVFPLSLERGFVHMESMIGGYFDYRQHFVDIGQLFFSNSFGYGSSVLGPGDDLSLSLGIVHWIVAALAATFAVVFYRRSKKISFLVGILLILELGMAFMMHQRSSFVWEMIPALTWLQFPWRLLAPSAFVLSILGALAVYLVSNRSIKMFFSAAIVGLVLVFNLGFFQPKDWFEMTDKQKFSGQSWDKQLTISIFDYLPIYAKFPPNHQAPLVPEVLEGEVKVFSYYKGSDFQTGELEVVKPARLRLPLFDFPGMTVKANSQPIQHYNNDCTNQEYCFGLVTIDLPAGNYYLEAKLEDTPVRTIGNLITLTSMIVILGMFIRSYYERKN